MTNKSGSRLCINMVCSTGNMSWFVFVAMLIGAALYFSSSLVVVEALQKNDTTDIIITQDRRKWSAKECLSWAELKPTAMPTNTRREGGKKQVESNKLCNFFGKTFLYLFIERIIRVVT